MIESAGQHGRMRKGFISERHWLARNRPYRGIAGHQDRAATALARASCARQSRPPRRLGHIDDHDVVVIASSELRISAPLFTIENVALVLQDIAEQQIAHMRRHSQPQESCKYGPWVPGSLRGGWEATQRRTRRPVSSSLSFSTAAESRLRRCVNPPASAASRSAASCCRAHIAA